MGSPQFSYTVVTRHVTAMSVCAVEYCHVIATDCMCSSHSPCDCYVCVCRSILLRDRYRLHMH